jgi:hypothetical protein
MSSRKPQALLSNKTSKRRSRFSRQKTGKRVQLTQRDLIILRLLARYRFLRSTHLHALAGGKSHKRFVERLGDLYHECGYVDRPKQQWQAINARYMPTVYELARAGRAILEQYDNGQDAEPLITQKHRQEIARQYHHELMICDVLASIEIGTRADPTQRFIPWPEILASAQMPTSTRNAANPLAVAVSITYARPGTRQSHHFNRPLIPDALFGLEYSAGNKKQFRFFALEADRNTEPIVRSNPQKSSYFRKILQYREVVAGSLYKAQWGLPNLMVLTVTTNGRHRQNIMRLVDELASGSGNSYLLFKTMPSLAALESAPLPVGDMLTEPWQRAGHSDFLIDRP